MKATGIIRRIDDLGRVVIPKEIRRLFRVREGDPLELYVDTNSIVLKKYSELQVMTENVNTSIRSLYKHMKLNAFVCDCDCVIAAPAAMSQLKGMKISDELTQLIRNNTELSQATGVEAFFPFDKDNSYTAIAVVPLYSGDNTFGCIVVLGDSERCESTDTIMTGARMAAEFIIDGIME